MAALMARGETVEHFRDPCPCGAGTIALIGHESGSMYGRTLWDTEFACPACREVWAIRRDAQRGGLVLSRRADLARREALFSEAAAVEVALERDVREPLVRVLTTLARADGRRRVSQWFEVIAHVLPMPGGEGEFRSAVKRAGSFDAWVRAEVRRADVLDLARRIAPRLAPTAEAIGAENRRLNDAAWAVPVEERRYPLRAREN